jgi:hypothetical protein
MVNNSDRTFFIQLILWTTANGISMISTWALIIAIARSPKARSISFNVYLIFSILPDAYKNTSGFFSNLANLVMTDGNPSACTTIGWNDAYWWCANLWMACIVFGHLRELLIANKNAQRHEPPVMSRVIIESTAVHIFSMVMASLTLIPVDLIPKATALSGCEAYPEEGNTGQHIFYWAFYLPVTALFPTMWVTGLSVDIWWRELLPVNGKSRSLLFYFARLLAVIYVVTLTVIVSFLFGGWVQAMAFVMFNLVGLLSVCLALMKKDIMRCWKQMWTCTSSDVTVADDNTNPDTVSRERIRVKIDVSVHFLYCTNYQI